MFNFSRSFVAAWCQTWFLVWYHAVMRIANDESPQSPLEPESKVPV
jgi:hypothetical protein